MEILTGVFTAFGLSASAGLNAYIPLLAIALLAKFTRLIQLSPPWDALESWWIISLLLLLALIEFFADKVPAINHLNDFVQTFVRPVAGAIAFAASAHVITNIHPVISLAAGLLIAGGVHAVKSVGVRPAVTTATAGAGNVPISLLEDFISTAVSILSIVIPILIGVAILLAAVWVIRRTWR